MMLCVRKYVHYAKTSKRNSNKHSPLFSSNNWRMFVDALTGFGIVYIFPYT